MKMTSSRQIAIAGAGIAGLTAALAFAHHGFQVRIFERSAQLSEVGAGIQVSPNATRILRRLGVLEAVEQVAVQPASINLHRADSGREIAAIALGEAAIRRWGAPYLAIHRADLHTALAKAVRAHPSIQLQTKATVRSVTFKAGGGATITVEKNNAVEMVSCDLAVGADGVHSALRNTGHLARPDRFSGFVAWRATAATQFCSNLIAHDAVSAFLHPRFHLITYPVRQGEIMNLVAIARMPAPEKTGNDAYRSMLPPSVIDGAADELDALVSDLDTWLPWPINEVNADAPWTDPAGLALIGDAAHALGPYAAQGAVMAIEDAAALAAYVAAQPDNPGEALARFEVARRERVHHVARRGAFNRFVWHAAGPLALGRDIVLKLRRPESLAADFDWLYGYDAQAI